MRLRIRKEFPGLRALWTDGSRLLGASGNRIVSFGKDGMAEAISVVGKPWERAGARVRVVRHFLRLGVHHLVPAGDGALLVGIRKRLLRIEASGRVSSTFRFPRGNKPAWRGICVAPDGTVLVAEYALNDTRKLPAMLHRSRDGGRSFEVIHEFRPGEVRHYHFVQWDPYERCLWMGTGDADRECFLFKSTDGGSSWRKVGGGGQLWRAVGVAFRRDALYWGTDAGSDAGTHPNHVVRLDRDTGELRKVLELQGPCHGTAALADGTLVVSTGVEGGRNERDRRAHLWVSRDGSGWTELASWAKDAWPTIVQFGVIRFPAGLERGNTLVFTGLGLVGSGETTFVAALEQPPAHSAA